MAIIKEKELESGVIGNYWVAETYNDMLRKTTKVIMLLFKNKDARDSGKTFIERVSIKDLAGVYLTGEQVYSKIKESKIELQRSIELYDENMNIISGGATEEVETNWFADAVDC